MAFILKAQKERYIYIFIYFFTVLLENTKVIRRGK